MGEFEKDIRDMFEDLEIAVDTGQLWSNIEKKLDKKDKRYPIWWILIPVLLLVLASLYFVVDTKKSEKNIKSEKTHLSNTNQDEQLKSNLYLKEKTPESPEKSKEKNTIDGNKTGKSKKRNTPNIFAINSDSRYTGTGEIVEQQNTKLKTDNNTESNVKKDGKSGKFLMEFKILPGKWKFLTYKQELAYNGTYGKYFERKPMKKPDFWSKSLDMSLGFALVDKKLTASDKSFDNYLNKRIKTENYLEAFNANIDINLKHSSGLFVSSGIHFNQIDEKFLDNDSLDIYKEKDGIIKEFQDEDGSVSYIKGQKEAMDRIIWDKKIYNYYAFIEIPVVAGYSFNIKNITVELNSGISYSWMICKKGQIIGVEGLPVDIAQEKDIFKTGSGLSVLAGMKILIPVKNKLFYIEPNAKYNIQSITGKNYPLSQRYFNYGVKIGYRYNFNK